MAVDEHEDRTATSVLSDGQPKRRLLAYWDEGSLAFDLPLAGQLTIGRGIGCDIRIDHGSVSRKHAVVTLDGELRVRDLGSANGTRVGATRLPANGEALWAAGEVVEVGKVVLVVDGYDARPAVRASPDETSNMQRLERLVDLVAPGPVTLLLLGETGVGKDVWAERIHERSKRAGSLLRLNCAAFSDSILESELFGHEKGAFTGASGAKPGLLESASGGSVLLDEVGELSLATQAKLLLTIERREVLRVGGLRPRPIDVRFIAATNRDLAKMAESGRFRQDLYFRLNGMSLRVPPLRERRNEIPTLARELLGDACRTLDRGEPTLTAPALEQLSRQAWPGNVRQLKTVIARMLMLFPDASSLGTEAVSEALEVAERTLESEPPPARPATGALPGDLRDIERQRILSALDECAGNQTRAAALLGMPRRTFVTRLDEYGIQRPRKGREK
jgi:two-component system response regulator AtoC